MRLCRFEADALIHAGFYQDDRVIPFGPAMDFPDLGERSATGTVGTSDLLDWLPPDGQYLEEVTELYRRLLKLPDAAIRRLSIAAEDVKMLMPIPAPPKLLLLAGNYASHIREDGSVAEDKESTFPYVFMKPPSTTLRDPCRSLELPAASPNAVDWEVELAVVIGARARNVPEAEALEVVAGYTILNDISDRRFRPNPGRKPRDWDKFFDWMHGKWHDGFAPCGPCIVTGDGEFDPQSAQLSLEVNGKRRQSGSTRDQIFPVASVIAFISSFITLEPGDIISTGTPAGVGSTTGTYLTSGDVMRASCSGIGTLETQIR